MAHLLNHKYIYIYIKEAKCDKLILYLPVAEMKQKLGIPPRMLMQVRQSHVMYSQNPQHSRSDEFSFNLHLNTCD